MMHPTKEKRFQELVIPHLNSAFNLARWLTRNGPDAEDIVQEAYCRAFTFFDSFYGEDGRAWLLTIVRNTFYTWHQQNQTQNTEFDEQLHGPQGESVTVDDKTDNNPESILMQKDSQQQLLHALQTLPLAFREVMVLRELEELSYKQIAIIIGIPVGTVMSRLGRGRELLQKTLQQTHRPNSTLRHNQARDGVASVSTPSATAEVPMEPSATSMQREV